MDLTETRIHKLLQRPDVRSVQIVKSWLPDAKIGYFATTWGTRPNGSKMLKNGTDTYQTVREAVDEITRSDPSRQEKT